MTFDSVYRVYCIGYSIKYFHFIPRLLNNGATNSGNTLDYVSINWLTKSFDSWFSQRVYKYFRRVLKLTNDSLAEAFDSFSGNTLNKTLPMVELIVLYTCMIVFQLTCSNCLVYVFQSISYAWQIFVTTRTFLDIIYLYIYCIILFKHYHRTCFYGLE